MPGSVLHNGATVGDGIFEEVEVEVEKDPVVVDCLLIIPKVVGPGRATPSPDTARAPPSA